MKFYIYRLTFSSGATYIGQHIEKKENDKYVTSSFYYKNHPEDILTKREILLYVKDKETLDIMETICIRADKADNPKNVNGNFGNWHYRFTFKGWKHSAENKKKTGERTKRLWKDPVFREKVIKGHTGRKNTEETKRLMSKSAFDSWTTERRENASKSGSYSHPHTEETKRRLSEQKKGRVHINNGKKELFVKNPEDYVKTGWKIGKLPVSSQTKKNMSEAARKRGCNTTGKKKIHKGDEGKFVKAEELDYWISQGWEIGVSDKRKELLRTIARKL